MRHPRGSGGAFWRGSFRPAAREMERGSDTAAKGPEQGRSGGGDDLAATALGACGSTSTGFTGADDASIDSRVGCERARLCGGVCTVVDAIQKSGTCGAGPGPARSARRARARSSCGGGTVKCGEPLRRHEGGRRQLRRVRHHVRERAGLLQGRVRGLVRRRLDQCGQACVNQQTDRTNCGACGTVCGAGEVCNAGKCELSCDVGLIKCSTSVADGGVSDGGSDASASDGGDGGSLGAAYCANPLTDIRRTAAAAASPAARASSARTARARRPAAGARRPAARQQRLCANLQIDTPTAARAGPSAPRARSAPPVPARPPAGSLTTCGSGNSAYCANLQSDNANCGTCGKVCAANLKCTAGVCVVPPAALCSDVAKAFCTGKGWTVVSWSTSFPNQPGGSIFCTSDGRGAGSDCDTCGTYNQIVWKATAKDACSSSQALVAGNVYAGHSPCSCQPNLLSCGTWQMQVARPTEVGGPG